MGYKLIGFIPQSTITRIDKIIFILEMLLLIQKELSSFNLDIESIIGINSANS